VENYVDILKQNLKKSVRKLKLGRKWVFQMDNDVNVVIYFLGFIYLSPPLVAPFEFHSPTEGQMKGRAKGGIRFEPRSISSSVLEDHDL
jgi:hypothetical protein